MMARSQHGVDSGLRLGSNPLDSGSSLSFGDHAMDGAATMSEIREKYRTPTRILLPKLLKSRDGWKAKSDARKVKLKAAQIKIRDLTVSREFWRDRAEQPQADTRQLQEQLQQTQRERDEARAELEDLKKR
jgi:hypothetical protein